MTKFEQKNEYLKMALKDFLMELEELLDSKVEIKNSHYSEDEKLISACPKNLTYELSKTGTVDLSKKHWDEIDYMRFRHSFKYKDGFTI